MASSNRVDYGLHTLPWEEVEDEYRRLVDEVAQVESNKGHRLDQMGQIDEFFRANPDAAQAFIDEQHGAGRATKLGRSHGRTISAASGIHHHAKSASRSSVASTDSTYLDALIGPSPERYNGYSQSQQAQTAPLVCS